MNSSYSQPWLYLPLEHLVNVCWAYKEKQIGTLSLRLFLFHVLQSRSRAVAAQSIADKLGVGTKTLRKAQLQLERVGLITPADTNATSIQFADLLPEAAQMASEMKTNTTRRIPIPSRLLGVLAQHRRPAEIISTLAHIIRCSFSKNRNLNCEGLVSASWVARVFGLSREAVHRARKWMLTMSIFTKQSGVPDHALKKEGEGFCFNVSAWIPALGSKLSGVGRFSPYIKITKSTTSTHKASSYLRSGSLRKQASKPDFRNLKDQDLGSQTLRMQVCEQVIAAGFLENSIDARALAHSALVCAAKMPANRVRKSRGAYAMFIIRNARRDLIPDWIHADVRSLYSNQRRADRQLYRAPRGTVVESKPRRPLKLWEQVLARKRARILGTAAVL